MFGNYSKRIQKILKENKISIGSRIQVKKGKETFEGILMPRISGDETSLILKLDSGYNVGIKVDSSTKIKKIGKAIKLGVIPKIKIKPKKGLPNVSIISTGGTIGTHVDYVTGGVFMTRTPEEILTTTPELQDIVNIKRTLNPFTIASEDMDYTHWQTLAKLTAKELNTGIDGVIITHGTDTLHFTSAALSFMLKNLTKPVVVVGAQRSPDRGSFDGSLNLICSAQLIAKSDIGEVCLVMHGSINDTYCFAHRGTKVRKMHTSRRDAFRSINTNPIAKIFKDGKVEYLNKYRKRKDSKVEADTKFEPKVALIKAFTTPPDIIDWYIEKKFKGLIIEGTGLGHVPTENKKFSWIPFIKKAVENGIFVGMTSQCLFGRVNSYVYRNLRIACRAGAVYLEDMLPEVAYVKLGYVLGHVKKRDEVKEMMLKNISGEITKRSEIKTFPL